MNEVAYNVGPADLTAANRLHFRQSFSVKRWSVTFLISALALAAIIFLLDGALALEGFALLLAAVWGMVVSICVIGWLLIPRQARRTWSQAQKFWAGQRMSWDADKIHFRSDKGESHVSWSDYYRWAADDRSLLLYQDSRSFYLLPLRDFPSGAGATMVEHLKAAGVQER